MQSHLETIICKDKSKPQGALQAHMLMCHVRHTSDVTSHHYTSAYGLTAPDCSDM